MTLGPTIAEIPPPWKGAHPRALHFDRRAERYERTRPEYPLEAINCIITELGIGTGSRVLDLAAGTGKLSRQLASTGAVVVSAEPLDGMRSQHRQTVSDALLVGSTAEAIPLSTGSMNVVTVAQAFHWFNQDLAQPEIHRVLEPGGFVGIIGYRFDRTVPWLLSLTALSNRYRRSYRKRLRSRAESAWAGVIRAIPQGASVLSRLPSSSSRPALSPALFTPLREHRFRYHQMVDVDTLLERVGIAKKLTRLPLPERERLGREVERCIRDLPPEVTLPYEVRFFWSRALPA